MHTIVIGATWVDINGTLYQRGVLRVDYNGDVVTIKDGYSPTNVLLSALYSEIINNATGAPYTSLGVLQAQIADGFFYNAVADAAAKYIPLTQKGAAYGVMPLNSTGQADAQYLPSYVDDVIEVANFASLPVTGETGKIYITLNTNKGYRWSGSTYFEVSPDNPNMLLQGGNSFGASVNIGSNDNNLVNIKVNGSNRGSFDTSGYWNSEGGVRNATNSNNSQILTGTNGAFVSRNVNDNQYALTANYIQGSGGILRGQFNGTDKFRFDANGFMAAPRIGISGGLNAPNYPIDLSWGSVAQATTLVNISQNSGYFQFSNGTGTASQFYPTLTATSFGRSDVGMHVQAQGSNGYTLGAFYLTARNAAGTGNVTSGNLFHLLNNATSVMSVDYQGNAFHSAKLTASSFAVAAMNTAPSSATDTGSTGEIRITAGYIYVCIAGNTWVRAALATW